MDNFIKILGNAKMAYTNMNINIDSSLIVKNIFDLLEENKENILKANKIDVKNNNGFKLDVEKIDKIKNELVNIENQYRKVIYMHKNENNYLSGKQIDNLGTICFIYQGETYCLLEAVLKAILTHNSIILVSEHDYMKATNELIIILIKRILKSYKVDENLVQISYTTRFDEMLSNNVSINKVIVIGDRQLQNNIKKISKIEVDCYGFNNYDLYIENLDNISFIKKVIKQNANIDTYVKSGLKVPFENYIEVEDIEEAILQINLNTSGYSSSIFTGNGENATKFLRDVKTANVSVNSSPVLENNNYIDIKSFLMEKNMFYPNPLKDETEENKFEFPTERSILEKQKNNGDKKLIGEIELENIKLKENNVNLEKNTRVQLEQKQIELDDLKRQLQESQNLANKYMNIFRKSFFSRLFSGINKKDIENDTKLLS